MDSRSYRALTLANGMKAGCGWPGPARGGANAKVSVVCVCEAGGGPPYDGHLGSILQPPSFRVLVFRVLQNKLQVSTKCDRCSWPRTRRP